MKSGRQLKLIEIIQKYEVETQEELLEKLQQEGYRVTQSTISRDIRELKLTKIAAQNGRQKYAIVNDGKQDDLTGKYRRVLQECYLSMDTAQNMVVIKTVSGMAMAVAAALDAFEWPEPVGTIAGDDTIMCATHSAKDAESLVQKIAEILGEV
jgi:transcriptional regulator of arginine metabolism